MTDKSNWVNVQCKHTMLMSQKSQMMPKFTSSLST